MILRVRKAAEQKILAHHVVPALTPWARIRGLIGIKKLSPGEGLWLVPCNSLHMFGMSIPLDVIFLDRSHKVLACISHLPPGKVVWPVRGAHSALELGVGSIALSGELTGTTLFFELVAKNKFSPRETLRSYEKVHESMNPWPRSSSSIS